MGFMAAVGSLAAGAAKKAAQDLNDDFGIGVGQRSSAQQQMALANQLINNQYTQMSSAGALTFDGGLIGASTGITTNSSSGLFNVGQTSYTQWAGNGINGPMTKTWVQVGEEEWQSNEYQENWVDYMGRSTAAPNRPPCPSCGNVKPTYKGSFDKHSEATGTVRFRTFHCGCGEKFTDPEKGMRLRVNIAIEELKQRVRDFKI